MNGINILPILYLVIINECTWIYPLSNPYFAELSRVLFAAFCLLQDSTVNSVTLSPETSLKLLQVLKASLVFVLTVSC